MSGEVVIGRTGARERRCVRNRYGHVIRRGAARKKQDAEKQRDAHGNEREPERVPKFGPAGTAVRVHFP
ncbi:MAG TPA: hypothetical protein VH044_14825 [Polyangiaceae bacterium]|nr:hypothetical protein [Polyangiaceae bacterium]